MTATGTSLPSRPKPRALGTATRLLLGRPDRVLVPAVVADATRELLGDLPRRRSQFEAQRAAVDGEGCARVVRVVLGALRESV